MTVQYFLRHGKVFRKDGYVEERFDSGTETWTSVRPAISDWLMWLDTDMDEIDESVARLTVPEAFATADSGQEDKA